MISNHQKQLHLFQSHANAWGGFATERGEAFNFHHVVSQASADALAGDLQNARLIDPYEADNYKDADSWVLQRQGWMNATPKTSGGGEPDVKAAPPKKTGSGKKPPGKKKKPRTSGQGAEPDVRKSVPPKTSGPGKKPPAKKPRTSGQGAEPD